MQNSSNNVNEICVSIWWANLDFRTLIQTKIHFLYWHTNIHIFVLWLYYSCIQVNYININSCIICAYPYTKIHTTTYMCKYTFNHQLMYTHINLYTVIPLDNFIYVQSFVVVHLLWKACWYHEVLVLNLILNSLEYSFVSDLLWSK